MVSSKVFEKLVNNRIIDHLEKSGLFSDFRMVLRLLHQLQIFSQPYLIELLGLLTDLGLLELSYLIYPRLLAGFGMTVYFSNLSLTELQVRYLALFLLFSVIDGFEWFWMESLHKNIQLMLLKLKFQLKFLKAPFLVLQFSCCILMTFLMMLSVVLLSMLMILLCSKCDQASDLWQQIQMSSELESNL